MTALTLAHLTTKGIPGLPHVSITIPLEDSSSSCRKWHEKIPQKISSSHKDYREKKTLPYSKISKDNGLRSPSSSLPPPSENQVFSSVSLSDSINEQASKLLMGLVFMHYKKGNWDAVISYSEQGLKKSEGITQKVALFYYCLGSAFLKRKQEGDLEKAERHLKKGWELVERNVDLRHRFHVKISKILDRQRTSSSYTRTSV